MTLTKATYSMIDGAPVNVLDYGADPTGVADSTSAIQNALDENNLVYAPAGTYLIDTVYLNFDGRHLVGAGKHLTTFKIKPTSSIGIARKDYGVRANSTLPVMMIGFELSDFAVDITDMTNADTSKGIAIEDGYDHVLRSIRIIDPLNETSARWGVELGRSLYTTTSYDCTIGRLNHKANTANAPFNFGTTINHHKIDSWHVRGRAYQYVAFYAAVIQKDADKFDLDEAIGNWTIIGGDFEDSGFFIRTTSPGTVTNIFTAGNSFNGFKGTLFGGTGDVPPLSSQFMDEHVPQSSRPITSITRTGTTVTVQISTTLGNGIYKFKAPIAGQAITVSGCGSPFDGFFTVATVNVGANSFTYETTTSGSATGTNGNVVPDTSVNGTYYCLGNPYLLYNRSQKALYNKNISLHNTPALFRGDEIGSFAPSSGGIGYTAQPAVDNYSAFIFRNAAGTTVGSITCTNSATSFNISSDYRLKDNVKPIESALPRVMQLKPCSYTFKESGSFGEGFIAHELQEVLPQAVFGEKDGLWPDGSMKEQGVDTSKIVAVLVAAVQELANEIKALKEA